MNKSIPYFRPSFGSEEATAINQYMQSDGYITEYQHTRVFENSIASFTNSKHCFAINNGTLSLVIALLAINIKPFDEVIVPNLTMVASANAVKLLGAVPILVDVESSTLTIDLDTIKNTITPKTKAIMHVSLNTRCHQLSELRNFCDQHQLYLIEDAAQSLGSYYQGKHIGTYGHIGSFSFSIPKIISTGQGGALITDDDHLAAKIKRLKDFGRDVGGGHDFKSFGINCKFTDLQAIIGVEQMKKLPSRINLKKHFWNLYYTHLSTIPEITIIPSNDDQWIPWIIDIYVENPEELTTYLKENQIGTRKQYPCLHQLEPYHNDYQTQKFPISQKFSQQGIWLPSDFSLSDSDIIHICSLIKDFYNQKKN